MASYNFDTSHSHVAFTVRHMVFSKVRGEFTKWSGSVAVDEGNPGASSVSVAIEVASIDTHEEKRDGHLRSADFFDVENHAALVFKAKSYSPANNQLQGDLTIKGITHPVTLEAEFGGIGQDPWGNTKAGFTLSGKINRKDWDLNWNAALEAGGVLVSDEVRLLGEIQLAKSN